jgi:hypothetical protein
MQFLETKLAEASTNIDTPLNSELFENFAVPSLSLERVLTGKQAFNVRANPLFII